MEREKIVELSVRAGDRLHKHDLTIATAESCTGGWIGKALTDVAGSSNWFECGFVTYSDEAKQDMLNVQPTTLQRYGAVSEQVVREMVRGAIANSRARVAVAVSGIAGPGGGTEDKPVGTVWLAWVWGENIRTLHKHLSGDRSRIREQTVEHALQGVLDLLA